MRPHLLELEAFGAFPGQVRLDLDELGASGLVLLSGDTGGGKTTLLDALGFALYGVVPGERAKARDDLRSHHAPPGVRARVRLELTARGRRLRVTRTPAQTRPKLRGTGEVVEHPTALLEQRAADGSWLPVATRPEDVGHEVVQLLGMDAGQFFQVVVLPQGRFAAFLQADHKDRERLLKQLFHVDRFESAERWLADRAAVAGAAVAAAREELGRVCARVAQAAGTEPPEDPEDEPGWAAALACEAAGAAAGSEAAATAASLARDTAAAALEAGEQLVAGQLARRAAQAELDALERQSEDVAALAAALDDARRAAPVQVALRAESDAASTLEAATAAFEAAVADVVLCGGGRDDVAGQARAAETEALRLEHLVEVQQRAAALDRTAEAALLGAEALDGRLRACQEWLEALPDARRALAEEVDAARAAALELPELRAAVRAAEEQRELAEQVAALEDRAASLRASADAARDQAVASHAAAERLRVERVDALVAELAFGLQDGCPCPVCGSLAHPEVPELLPVGDVGKEAELLARRRAAELDEAAATAERDVAVHEERLAGLRARLTGPADPDLPLRLAAVQARAGRLADAEERWVLLAAEGETRYAELARVETRLEEERKRAAEASDEAQRLRERLRQAGVEPDADLAGARRSALLLARACDAGAAAERALAAAVDALAQARAAAAALVEAAGFPGAAEAAAAVRAPAVVQTWEARVVAHRDALAGVRARLDVLDAPLDVAVDLDGLRAAVAAAEARLDTDLRGAAVARERASALDGLLAAHAAAVAAVGPLRERAATVRGLSDLAAGRGANRLSMPLSSFVLAARLEEVAAAASQRLLRMSGGRYSLRHSDAGRDRRTRAGLGLAVEDGWTGRVRDTATLSGGETFMTALSLALGLADVVTAEAGGRTLDALFVDEGFGSLDADTLDAVMDVLDDLRSGGRLVGVVSHVADLKQRIPTQVRVHKGPQGSTVSTT